MLLQCLSQHLFVAVSLQSARFETAPADQMNFLISLHNNGNARTTLSTIVTLACCRRARHRV